MVTKLKMVRHTAEGGHTYKFHRIQYDEKNNLLGWEAAPVIPAGSDIRLLAEEVREMLAATNLFPLYAEDLP